MLLTLTQYLGILAIAGLAAVLIRGVPFVLAAYRELVRTSTDLTVRQLRFGVALFLLCVIVVVSPLFYWAFSLLIAR